MLIAQSWITFITLLGAAVVGVSALSGYFTLQADHRHAVRDEAAVRKLHADQALDLRERGYLEPWTSWATGKTERERIRLGLPIATWDDISVSHMAMKRVSLAVSLASVKGDLIAVGAGLVLSTAASVWSVWV